MSQTREDAIIGCLLGTAVGDAVGLCAEGLSRRRLRRFYPDLDGPHFFLGRGLTSDDTEHTCMLAQALIVSAGDADRFARSLAWRLRFWLLGLPAGIGRATLRAILKLWLGFPPTRSGVYSAGNGPAMRSALLGVCYGHDPDRLRRLVRASTRLTHTDPRAEQAALAVALAAYTASREPQLPLDPGQYRRELHSAVGEGADEFVGLVECAAASAAGGEPAEAFATALGLARGVSGYAFHTVPVVLQVWFRQPGDYRGAVREVIACGGDTDTTAAILGALVGARVGRAGIPKDWLGRLWEWPRSVAWMERLGRRLAEVCRHGRGQRPLPLSVPGLAARNLVFFLLVLLHVLRRLLPPY